MRCKLLQQRMHNVSFLEKGYHERRGMCPYHPRPNLLGDPRRAIRAEILEEAKRKRYCDVNRQ